MNGEYQTMTRNAVSALRRVQFAMDVDMLLPGVLDEVALLFANEESLMDYYGWALRWGGMEPGSISVPRDTMEMVECGLADELAHKDGTECKFDVRFEFLKIPGALFRFECMTVLEGCAPLHQRRSNGSVIHVSYKPTDYDKAKKELAQADRPFMAEYRNSYGKFSYWKYGNLFLKPRVNLRDQ